MTGAAVSLCLFFLMSFCSACYISNCPIGGKRSVMDSPQRKCMLCGPGEQGRCFGPSICCGEGLGCWMGSPETARCMEENYLSTPCQAGGRPCGSEAGRCAAPGICCDSGKETSMSCFWDDLYGYSTGSNRVVDTILCFLYLRGLQCGPILSGRGGRRQSNQPVRGQR
uniref:Oxytocin n=1 Tax=Salmo trutta TaxID=8032 RepID=A0A674B6C1_SALTR